MLTNSAWCFEDNPIQLLNTTKSSVFFKLKTDASFRHKWWLRRHIHAHTQIHWMCLFCQRSFSYNGLNCTRQTSQLKVLCSKQMVGQQEPAWWCLCCSLSHLMNFLLHYGTCATPEGLRCLLKGSGNAIIKKKIIYFPIFLLK